MYVRSDVGICMGGRGVQVLSSLSSSMLSSMGCMHVLGPRDGGYISSRPF